MTVHLVLHGLKRHAKYKVRAVATSSAGHGDSAAKSLLTKKAHHKKKHHDRQK